MTNEQTPRRKPGMRGALEGGCSCWTPIRPAGNDERFGDATGEPLTAPDADSAPEGKPSPAPDAEP